MIRTAAILLAVALLAVTFVLTATTCSDVVRGRGAQATATYGAAQFHAQLTAVAGGK